MLTFPAFLAPSLNTRAGVMLAAGRLKATIVSHKTGEHLTLLFKCFADNRNRQFDQRVDKNWVACTLAEATHVFVEVPNASGGRNDKVGTFYPLTGLWHDADRADRARVNAAAMVARWVNGEKFKSQIMEAAECARCGRELTDPVSIARGIGPDCFGAMTGSQHQVKVREASRMLAGEKSGMQMQMLFDCEGKVTAKP